MKKLAWLAAALLIARFSYGAAPAFEAAPWLEDLEQTRTAFGEKYANLEWAVFEREADLNALFADAKKRIAAAENADQARDAFERLARRLGDGHVQFKWANPGTPAALPLADCSALGFEAHQTSAPTLAPAQGYVPLANPPAREFPAGVLEVTGHRLGVLKIGLFSPHGHPELCTAALSALQLAPGAACDEACSDRIVKWTSDRLTADLALQLRALKAAGAEALLVDITGNGGGSEWAEAAVRMVTAMRLKPARMGFVRGAHWAKTFANTENELRDAATFARGGDRALLTELATEAAAYRRMAETPCDSAPLWRSEKPACAWVVAGFYAAGLMPDPDPARLKNKPWAQLVFEPVKFGFEAGVWRGPLIVLVDGNTWSAAEEFAAELQDNRAAVILGAPTGGAGCGHTDGGTPTTLRNSGGVLELPDCVRFRADGSNEVMGIQPDVLVGLRREDGPHRRALRVAEKLPEAMARALQTNK